ncbi:MAG: hypothetical protein BGO19_17295 [Acinetobacter sp. 38-8]|nr:MAG: hypothetical protein BGO19_17295 [Acinetobacter sp. 38-8]
MLKTVELFNGKKININIVKGRITDIREYVENDQKPDTQKARMSRDQILIMTSSQREMLVYLQAQDINLSVGQQVSIAFLENERDNYLILYNQENRQLSLFEDGNWLKLLDEHKILRPKRYILWSRLLTFIAAFYFVLGVLWMILGVLGGVLGNPFYAFGPIFLYEHFFKDMTTSYIFLIQPWFLWPLIVVWGFFYFISTRVFLYFWKDQAVNKIREEIMYSFKEEVDS